MAYRLDRVERVFVSGETFTLPDDYDEDELLRYAWGIWRSEKKPYTNTNITWKSIPQAGTNKKHKPPCRPCWAARRR